MPVLGTPDKIRARVLVVEDDEHLARAVKTNLSVRGWTVDVVSTGAAVLSHLECTPVDVVLLDMRLPDTSGLKVLQRIRALPHPPPVVLVSGYLDLANTLEAMHEGAYDVLEKPIAPADLIRVLNAALRAGAPSDTKVDVPELVGRSAAMQALREQVAKIAAFQDLPVLIMGESGTGKEVVAGALHRLGPQSGPLVALNCAALPEALFESELFGHTSGAFTGATSSRAGLLDAAGTGTVFLDEIGEMSPNLQAKLLRVLETRTFRRVGSNEDRPLRARIVSATNRRLRGRDGEALRGDLFFRLAGFTLLPPPLRSRMEDIECLAIHFLAGFAALYPFAATRLSREALDALATHDWPGNVRELRAVLQSALVRSHGGVLGVRHIAQALHGRGRSPLSSAPPPTMSSEPPPSFAVESPAKRSGTRLRTVPAPSGEGEALGDDGLPEVERSLILRVAQECEGNLSQAARRLKIPRSTLRDRLRRYGVR
jgi:DNA-binding NtrC family response regulator